MISCSTGEGEGSTGEGEGDDFLFAEREGCCCWCCCWCSRGPHLRSLGTHRAQMLPPSTLSTRSRGPALRAYVVVGQAPREIQPHQVNTCTIFRDPPLVPRSLWGGWGRIGDTRAVRLFLRGENTRALYLEGSQNPQDPRFLCFF